MSNRNWSFINNRLVRQGTILVDLQFLENCKAELAGMNDNKEGARFKYSESLVQYAGVVRCLMRLPYRQTQGLLIGIAKQVPVLQAPCYTQIQRRFNKLNVKIQPKKCTEPFCVAVDSTGISVTQRGEWMRKIHRKGKNDECKGFLKIHVAVDVKTKEIVAIEVTRENVGDNTMLKPVLIQTVENTDRPIDKLLADGGYDTYDNFDMCHDLNIEPVIRIDDNAITTPPPDTYRERRRGEPIRRKHARIQLANRNQWKKDTKYGLRWIAESVFSVLKRRHGENIQAHKYNHMQHEMYFKATLYNQLL